MSTFKVSVNSSEPIDVKDTEVNSLDCIELPNHSYHVLENSKSYHVTFKSKDLNNKSYLALINGREYQVNIQDELDELIKSMGFQIGSSKHVNQIKSPMPGLILDILVKEGQEVKEGDLLLILEAMKMENSIVSPTNGKVKTIAVSKETTVTKNELLIEFE
ncbi:MAG: acetyl-CoA carboxylase biotin carboxyl carrier protein subunit [Flavobacteriaceae bacterium]|nr:acetyl-CoA carboxylase biotin carboxyl carrier protein subunit [Mangrovimonas sp.]MCB0469287.1 acetyl-CoA carboxylase biotin carboxyl carrier protein subunit [Flavobacteriaceae bacterium]MCB0432034.1 acetyl-CoA carboxylase biotin carboxyl carrier protein subunit [Mangrovimonas sp.]MCB0435854.1 acetyl-CoA carboxylase biotin carboxyl carrier protein subunit [Mangrovimonas sp.]HPF97959.1 acetyl-CoA carboxylase biotin carboxyl carrier protein subunit [Mangrovimonas sp.]